jgi:hypothetical protein
VVLSAGGVTDAAGLDLCGNRAKQGGRVSKCVKMALSVGGAVGAAGLDLCGNRAEQGGVKCNVM